LRFDDRDEALSDVGRIQEALDDGGIEFHVVDIEGVDALVVELDDEQGPTGLAPGYVVLDDYLVVGTTLTSLRQAVQTEMGDIPSLWESAAFSRPLEAVDNSTDFMIYGNIRRIAQEAIDQLDETELIEHGDTSEPFVEPLEAFILGVAVEEDLVTISAVVTCAEPTTERTASSTRKRRSNCAADIRRCVRDSVE